MNNVHAENYLVNGSAVEANITDKRAVVLGLNRFLSEASHLP